MDDAKVPDKLQEDCIRYLIDTMTVKFRELKAIDPNRVLLVESAGILSPDDWANELHPKASGFKKIAKQAWAPVLKEIDLT